MGGWGVEKIQNWRVFYLGEIVERKHFHCEAIFVCGMVPFDKFLYE